MVDAMLDFETLDTSPNAVIIQIGACYFDRRTGEIGRKFKCNVDAKSAVDSGAILNPDTVYWWLNQDKAAIESVTADPKIKIQDAMNDLNKFLQGAQHIWSHATFDFVILTQTLRRLGIKPWFNYKSGKDIRTLTHLARLTAEDGVNTREGVHHDALDDCIFQVKYTVACLNKLAGMK